MSCLSLSSVKRKPLPKVCGNRAVGYARVSRDRQAEEGVSLDVQEEKLRAAAVMKELDLVEVIIDPGESGKDLDRPGMQRLLAMVRAREITYVIIPKLDRLSRKVADAVELVDLFAEHGVELYSLHESFDTTTPMGRFCLHLFASLAQMEREPIVERVKEALDHKR